MNKQLQDIRRRRAVSKPIKRHLASNSQLVWCEKALKLCFKNTNKFPDLIDDGTTQNKYQNLCFTRTFHHFGYVSSQMFCICVEFSADIKHSVFGLDFGRILFQKCIGYRESYLRLLCDCSRIN